MTAAGEWRVGRNRAEHVYEGAGTDNHHDDQPVASFLGARDVAANDAAEAVLAVNTVRSLGTTDFRAEYQAQELTRSGFWQALTPWNQHQGPANARVVKLREEGWHLTVRVVRRWVTEPEDIGI